MIYAIARLSILVCGSEILQLGEECCRILIEKKERSDTTNLQS